MKKKDLIIIVFYIYMISVAGESFIRYYLQNIGIESLIYLRDVAMIIAIICSIKKRIYFFDICLFSLAIIAIICGIYFTDNVIQVIAGIKIYLPFIYGYIIVEYYFTKIKGFERLYEIVFFMTCIGILLEFYLTDPYWQKLSDIELAGSIGGGVQTANILVGNDYYNRIAGFTRLFNIAAELLGLCIVWIYIFSTRSKYTKIAYAVLGAVCIILTTSKANIVTYFLLCIMWLLNGFMKKYLRIYVYKFLAVISTLMLIILPVVSIFISSFINELNSDMLMFLFASTDDRMINSWPYTYHIIIDYGSIMFGRGFGGVGMPVSFFDKFIHVNSPIDNLFVYSYGTFGIFSIALIFISLYKLIKIKSDDKKVEYLLLLYILIGFNGVMNDLAGQIMMMHIGILVGGILMFNSKEKVVNEVVIYKIKKSFDAK